jgi:acetyl-CoA carboxylase alpha subunit
MNEHEAERRKLARERLRRMRARADERRAAERKAAERATAAATAEAAEAAAARMAEIGERQQAIDALVRDVNQLTAIPNPTPENAAELERLRREVEELKHEFYIHLSAWPRVQLARHPQRPYTDDYIRLLFENFSEIHGDRRFADDSAIITGMARFHGKPVMIVGSQKGRDTKTRVARNFGQAKPEGYRKALRAMELAAKFGRPIIVLVDTPGAYPGVDAEERGQAEALAQSARNVAAAGTDHRDGDGGGRFGRRAGDCGGRPRAHAGKFDLLGDFTGRVRVNRVAGFHEGRNSRRSTEDHGYRSGGVESDR